MVVVLVDPQASSRAGNYVEWSKSVYPELFHLEAGRIRTDARQGAPSGSPGRSSSEEDSGRHEAGNPAL